MQKFTSNNLTKLFSPHKLSNGEDNGQVTIIGGSHLFHGAPLLALKATSRVVDMVFFATPDKSVGEVASKLKASLSSFIWVPWEDTEDYIQKSDAVLIGPGFMRFGSEKIPGGKRFEECDGECQLSREITYKFLSDFPDKKWVIDAGSLQVMEAAWIPAGAILTPNTKEYKVLFGNLNPETAAKKHDCIIVLKGPTTYVYTPSDVYEIKGGNAGLTKGGTGDVQSGLTAGLLAKNEADLAACAAAFLVKLAADELYGEVKTNYNSDDLANQIGLAWPK